MAENIQNNTVPTEFSLRAFPGFADVEMLLFILVLLMYLLSVLGNLVIIALICVAPQLHTPMYFFLCNLAFQDIVHVSAIQPKLMAIIITGDHSISFPGCISQIFLFVFCLDAEFFLLPTMAYDRYVAICVPLRYSVIMNKSVCTLLAVTVWLLAGLNALMCSSLISNLSFCKSHELNHFYYLFFSRTDQDILQLFLPSYSCGTTVWDLSQFLHQTRISTFPGQSSFYGVCVSGSDAKSTSLQSEEQRCFASLKKNNSY
uniref:G-protein coupled receptors family 1 profile domain-containing protein n=1 Tax=Xenopus tropicalis TaxID=8364 RepID=A0A7D9NK09_XENTR